ncbi:DEAD/DEAH box helicase [Pseudomonas mangrovi]|uniref:AAA family ATPase n=1 Tax=Pseudomonas mangrovi TaxID=2161748 RepID=A0A2T5PDN6_9PSED|nr:AAA domain-containing protein [Pseudomonas mangrovi]PTU75840.1 AAA family ATPase [Pseudomonas mangrovi]
MGEQREAPEEVRQRIGFYRSCYLADSRDLDLDNLGKLRAERWAWLDGRDELACGDLPVIALPPALGAELDKQQNLYQRELQLVYGVLPICGRLQREDAPALSLCGPLVYYEARLSASADADGYLLTIDTAQPHANWRLLRSLMRPEHVDELSGLPLPAAAIDAHVLGELLQWLQRFTLVEDVLQGAAFPRLDEAQTLSKARRGKPPSLRAAAFVALVARGSGSRGIAHELQQLQQSEALSAPLRRLLGEALPADPREAVNSTPESLPSLLSAAQVQALDSAARFDLSQIAGPPGTGKSYTLAALALDRYLNGESVLVVSRSEQAVRVVADKLRHDFGLANIVLDGNGQDLRRALRAHLDDWLQGNLGGRQRLTQTAAERHCRNQRRRQGLDPDTPLELPEEPLRAQLQALVEQERGLAEAFRQRAVQALRWSSLIERAQRRALGFWARWWTLPRARRQVREAVRPWELLDRLRQCQREREQSSQRYLGLRRREQLGYLVATERPTLVRYNQALRARNSQRQLALFDDIEPTQLLTAFPIWVMTLDELHRLLPLRAELFDVMLMDEASQCDIASALPAFQRCRRAVVCGDVRQLRHVSFLSRQREVDLLVRAGLDARDREQWSYRDNSVLDLVGMHLASQQAVTFLDEHFRSRPALIRFSNEQFYNGQLKVMKERPGQESPGLARPSQESPGQPDSAALAHAGCDSLQLVRLQGERASNGVNQAEVDWVLNMLGEHLRHYAASPLKPSIGVLSPFRDQVDAIREQVAASLSLEQVREFRLLIATPYGFQGEERDLMIISFAIHGGSSQAAAYLNREDMFNVAITRARERQLLLYSGDEKGLPSGHLLRRYLENLHAQQREHPAGQALNGFQQALCSALQAHGVRTWANYPLAGLLLDLFCQRGDKYLAIDLVGFPGEGEGFLELERYLVLARAGLETLPLSYALWTLEPELALQALLQRL